jgi:hypothetical protein
MSVPVGTLPPCLDHRARIERLDRRVASVEENIGSITAEVAAVRTTLGRAPDPIAGTPGTGAVGVIYRLGNHLIADEASAPMPEEGEVTSVQNRADLVHRAKEAEIEVEKQRTRVRLAAVGAVVTLITTAGTIAMAWLAK